MPEYAPPAPSGGEFWPTPGRSNEEMRWLGRSNPENFRIPEPQSTTRRTAIGFVLGAPLLSACAGVQQSLSQFWRFSPPAPAGPAQQPAVAGNGQVKVGLILPLSASGNAGVAAQSMKNAAEMALAEFQNPNIQILIKDDGGCPRARRRVRSRRSMRAPRSSWGRCLQPRYRRWRRSRARAAFP